MDENIEAAEKLEEVAETMKKTIIHLELLKDTIGIGVDDIISLNDSIQITKDSIRLSLKIAQEIRDTAV